MNQPTLDDWRRLYVLMDRVKALAPWTWMDEAALFGVQNPDTGEQGFVSVMGSLGEHFAIGLYLGARGLYGFWEMQNSSAEFNPELLLTTPQLQASFEDRDQLHPHDRALIKQLGLKYRGRQAWPMFRSLRPSFVPWYLDQAEARFLALGLEQLLDVAPRYHLKPSLFRGPTPDHYLFRVSRRAAESIAWEDQVMAASAPEPLSLNLRMNMDALAFVKSLPATRQQVEMDLFMMLSGVQEAGPDARPYFPHVLLSLEVSNKVVLGADIIPPLPSLERVYEEAPGYAVAHLAQAKVRPAVISVRHEVLYQVLGPVAKELGVKLLKRRHLSHLDRAKASLMQWIDRH